MGYTNRNSKSKLGGFTAMLLCGVSFAAPGYAQTATWTGAQSNDASVPENWDFPADGSSPSETIANTANGRNPVTTVTAANPSPEFGWGTVKIGDGSTGSGTGSWTVDFTPLNPDGQGNVYANSVLVGTAGGTGSLTVNFGAPSPDLALMSSSMFSMGNASIGNGLGSTGTVNFISTGAGHRNALVGLGGYVGKDGGNGTVNIDGPLGMAQFLMVGVSPTPVTDVDGNVTNAANIAGTTGVVNVLNGGKLGNQNSIKVGDKGGTGTINVSGTNADSSTPSTLKSVGASLIVGRAEGSTGTINVDQGGAAWIAPGLTYDPVTGQNTVSHEFAIGTQGGTGNFIVSGADSTINVGGYTPLYSPPGSPPSEGLYGELVLGDTGGTGYVDPDRWRHRQCRYDVHRDDQPDGYKSGHG